MVQSFKQALRKSSLPPNAALLEFLMHYRRTPLETGYSSSQLLHGRQIRCKIETVIPSPAHSAQGRQSRSAQLLNDTVNKIYTYKVGDPYYALYCGPRRSTQPRWVQALVTKVYGQRSVDVKVWPSGPTRRRHVEQLQPRFSREEDRNPEDMSQTSDKDTDRLPIPVPPEEPVCQPRRPNPRHPLNSDYGPDNLR
ncbi:uncharacterized protein [Watersipora subatra]|uniref:uncharacterized protein n=1 Tax=Watersipora subatra TaxID=2589382 RepID=UPI00355C720C